MKIAICDDEKPQRDYLQTLVQKWSKRRRDKTESISFSSAESFLFAWDEDKTFDMLLLDIQMDHLNGMDLARKIRSCDQTLSIVFITGYSDYMDQGYEVAALHYLLKPVQEKKLFSTLDRALVQAEKRPEILLVESAGQQLRLPQNEIDYIESLAHTLEIHTENQVITVHVSIDSIEKALNPVSFFRIHRSYLVGLRHIRQFGKNELLLDDGTRLPISRRRYQAANQAFIRYYREGTIE
ncbi:MAG: LytR/AlgR family response regulator transcription factor [Sporolactobacillus sp.]